MATQSRSSIVRENSIAKANRDRAELLLKAQELYPQGLPFYKVVSHSRGGFCIAERNGESSSYTYGPASDDVAALNRKAESLNLARVFRNAAGLKPKQMTLF